MKLRMTASFIIFDVNKTFFPWYKHGISSLNNNVCIFEECPARGLQKNINVCNVAPLHGNL